MTLRSPWVRGPVYLAVFLGVFAVTLWTLLPYPEIARNAEARLHDVLGLHARVEGLAPGPFPGLEARRVRVGPGEGLAEEIELTEVKLRVPLSRLLRAAPVVEVEALALGGTVTASYPLRRGTGTGTQASWSGVDLGRLPRSAEFAGLPVEGKTSGELHVRDPLAGPEEIEGRLTATLTGVRLGPGRAMGLPAPELVLGDGRVRASAEGGKVEVETAQFEGGDLGVEFTGSLLVREDATRSLVNGVLSLLPNDKASQDLALVFAIFPGARGSDGRYTARVRGSLAAPRLVKR
ncbi:MAG: type II secretion system protein GspN [Deferrisomatales bacterium]